MTDINTENQGTPEPINENLDEFSVAFFATDNAKENSKESDDGQDTQDIDPESDSSEGEFAEGTEDEDTDNGEELEAKEEPPVKKKSRFQERIDDMTTKLREGERSREALEAQLAAAIARLDKAAEPQNTNTNTTPKTEGLVEPTADDTLEDGSPKYPLGEFDPKLVRDLTRYDRAVEREHENKVRTEELELSAKQQEATQLQAGWNTKVDAAKEVYPDYVEKGQTLINELQDMPQDYALYLTENLMKMDYGPDVFYYLAEHPEEARVIANGSPDAALVRLGRIEARFAIAADERSGKETKLRTTNAPVPPATRTRGTNAAAPSIDLANANLDDFSREFFKKK